MRWVSSSTHMNKQPHMALELGNRMSKWSNFKWHSLQINKKKVPFSVHTTSGVGNDTLLWSVFIVYTSRRPSYLWFHSVKSFESWITQERAGAQQTVTVEEAVLSGNSTQEYFRITCKLYLSRMGMLGLAHTSGLENNFKSCIQEMLYFFRNWDLVAPKLKSPYQIKFRTLFMQNFFLPLSWV